MVSRLKIPPRGRFQDGRRAHGHYYKDFVLVVVRYRICTWANQFIWMYCIYCMCGGLEKPVTWSTVFCFLSFILFKLQVFQDWKEFLWAVVYLYTCTERVRVLLCSDDYMIEQERRGHFDSRCLDLNWMNSVSLWRVSHEMMRKSRRTNEVLNIFQQTECFYCRVC